MCAGTNDDPTFERISCHEILSNAKPCAIEAEFFSALSGRRLKLFAYAPLFSKVDTGSPLRRSALEAIAAAMQEVLEGSEDAATHSIHGFAGSELKESEEFPVGVFELLPCNDPIPPRFVPCTSGC